MPSCCSDDRDVSSEGFPRRRASRYDCYPNTQDQRDNFSSHSQDNKMSRSRYSRRRRGRSVSRRGRSASPVDQRCSDVDTLPATDSPASRRVRPRDFNKPLTCFFWHHTGKCNKSDAQCIYAHHHTGMIAEPPISHKGKILGGKGAQRVINGMAKREEDMSARAHDLHQGEQRLAAAETAISEREKSLTRCEQANKEREDAFAEFEEHMLRKLEAGYHGIVATVQRIRRDMAQAQRILTHRREQVLYHENFSDSLRGVYGQGRYGGSIAIDGVLGAMGGFGQSLSEAEATLLSQIESAIRNNE